MRKLVVGLTGGIGTGKSAALAVFRRLGAAAVDADALARQLSRKGGPLQRAVARAFGRRFLDARGRLDRKALAAAVFAHRRLRRRLERAAHPEILRRIRTLIARSRRPVVVADVPLLFERRLQSGFDATVVVSAPEDAALRRLLRRGMGRETARARMRAQWPLRRKEALADLVLDNSGARAKLRRMAGRYYRAFELIARSGAT